MDIINLVTLALPIVLGLLMFGVGLSLTPDDFFKVKEAPKPVILGLLIQLTICPLVAFALIYAFHFPPTIGIGFMLLAATPGGPSANVFSMLSKGDVALNITMTAANTLIGAFFIPFILWLAFLHFMGSTYIIPIQTAKIVQTMFFVIIPMAIGMVVRRRAPGFATRSDKLVRQLSLFFVFILAGVGIFKERELLLNAGFTIFFAVLLFNVINLILAYYASKMMKLNRRQRIAITFEVGVHNCVLAFAIALNPDLLNSTEMAIPAVFYSAIMYVTAWTAMKIFNRSDVVATT